jgi:hypothetical protein
MSALSNFQSVLAGIGQAFKKPAQIYENVPILGQGVKMYDDMASNALNMPKNSIDALTQHQGYVSTLTLSQMRKETILTRLALLLW